MPEIPTTLDALARPTLLPIAYEYMLYGMIVNRAMLPQVVLGGGGLDALNDVAIDEWMGASPVYTRRLRELMGIEGHDVEAIMKALQLDVGFVHGYMDVVYDLRDERYGEFRLNHCGALLDAEPHGEAHVFGMCHTIEDPTFDATALATNPRARIRPIHRPPRQPADRHPHCHWTIEIDPENEPVGPARLTEQVAALPLAAVGNDQHGTGDEPGLHDYRGPLRPDLRLGDLATPTLAAVARELQMQSHLLVASGELALAERFGAEPARAMIDSTWVGSAWILSERLAGALALAPGDPAGLATVLGLQPAIPPGFERAVEVDGTDLRLTLTATVDGLADPAHPGCPGLLARGEVRGIEAMVRAVEPRTAVSVTAEPGRVVADVSIDLARDPAPEPPEIPLMRVGMVTAWRFDVLDRVGADV